jgi:fructokinase
VRIISIGEVLWDVIGDTEHLGGAPFNFAAHLQRLGHHVAFVSAVGLDQRGDRVVARMAEIGVSSEYVSRHAGLPTGTVTVSLSASGQPTFAIHRPAAYDYPQLSAAQFSDLLSTPASWVYFGTLMQTSRDARKLTQRLLSANKGAERFYDVNLRPGSYNPPLVRELLAQASVVKLNDSEVPEVAAIIASPQGSLEEFCRKQVSAFGWKAVCVTTGAQGCVALIGGKFVQSKGYPVRVADTVGAGDAFAAAFVHGLCEGWKPEEVADFANRVGAFVASRTGAIPAWTVDEVLALKQA